MQPIEDSLRLTCNRNTLLGIICILVDIPPDKVLSRNVRRHPDSVLSKDVGIHLAISVGYSLDRVQEPILCGSKRTNTTEGSQDIANDKHK